MTARFTPVRSTRPVETLEQDEAETSQGINDALHDIMEITSKDYGHAVRSVHAKAHGLAFSPWHGLVAHQPLGAINPARRSAYPMSAQFRAEFNRCPIHEPVG